MKPHEKTVYNYLKSLGYEDIQFEPIPNETPDFVVNDNIAIEVRRLHENYGQVGDFQGLEEKGIPLFKMIRSILAEFPSDNVNHSSFLFVRFERPLTVNSFLRKRIRKILVDHLPFIDQRKSYSSGNLRIDIVPTHTKYDTIYRDGISSDFDSGGEMIELLQKNLELIIREKEQKIVKNQALYPEWWLALVDTDLLTQMYPEDWEQFYIQPKIESAFKRLMVVTNLVGTDGMFLYE